MGLSSTTVWLDNLFFMVKLQLSMVVQDHG